MTALQAGSKGTQACINAISVIQGVVGDLETTVMFANAKTLNPESKESFGKHKEDLLGSCQKLVEETKRLVSSVQATQVGCLFVVVVCILPSTSHRTNYPRQRSTVRLTYSS